jgi:hypothetical protein
LVSAFPAITECGIPWERVSRTANASGNRTYAGVQSVLAPHNTMHGSAPVT